MDYAEQLQSIFRGNNDVDPEGHVSEKSSLIVSVAKIFKEKTKSTNALADDAKNKKLHDWTNE